MNITNKHWNRFWDWYSEHITENLLIILVIHIAQIPHMIWAGDCFLEVGIVCKQFHPFIDLFLYGIDLIELFSLAQIISMIYAYGWRKKHN